MLYKPNYCCNCGDRIERIEWTVLTSRRFCSLCEKEFSFADWFPRVLGMAIFIFGLFAVGNYLDGVDKPLEISSDRTFSKRQIALYETKLKGGKTGLAEFESKRVSNQTQSGIGKEESRFGKFKQDDSGRIRLKESHPKKPQRVVSEPIYFCGAETKKGSACSRRVRGGGRCWQHKGRKAMLSKKDLLIKK